MIGGGFRDDFGEAIIRALANDSTLSQVSLVHVLGDTFETVVYQRGGGGSGGIHGRDGCCSDKQTTEQSGGSVRESVHEQAAPCCPEQDPLTGLCPFHVPFVQGEMRERARIVAYLRQWDEINSASYIERVLKSLIDAVERGEHE